MNWTKSESDTKPTTIDTTLSEEFNYIRKDIVQVTKIDEDGAEHISYEYLEAKVSKDDWMLVSMLFDHNDAIDDIVAFLLES